LEREKGKSEDRNKRNAPWKATCFEDGTMFSLAKASPVFDCPCMYKVVEDFGFVKQRRENNLFHGFNCNMATSQISETAHSKEDEEEEKMEGRKLYDRQEVSRCRGEYAQSLAKGRSCS
jgi:hypothetical protein